MFQSFGRRVGREALLGLSLLGGVAIALLPSSASACKCRPLSPQEARDGAAAVFEARVTKISDELATAGGPPPGKLVTVSIVRTWKGLQNHEEVTLRTSESSASCGVAFELDTSYLVYAGGSPEALTVNSCGGTRPLADASDDLALLGAGDTPVRVDPVDAGPDASATGTDAGSSPPPPARRGGCATSGGSSGSALLWTGAPLLGVVLRRRSRSDRKKAAGG